jgi:hypothetical protein
MPDPLETLSRQKKFMDIYKKTLDPAVAAEEAWPELPPRRRANAARRVLDQSEVRNILSRYDLSLKTVASKHRELLDNERPEIQMRATELGYKMLGIEKIMNAPEPVETNVQVNIDQGRLAEVANRLEAINKKMITSSPSSPATTAEIVEELF